MLEEFIPLRKVDIQSFIKFNNQLKEILDRLDKNTIFEENFYSEESYKKLIKSFVTNQRGSLGNTTFGSWSLVPNDKQMDSESRVDFIFMPTYLVTAILSRTLCDFPFLVESIPDYKDALKKGLLFCSYRNLEGHGYDSDSGAAEALKILSVGKVPFILEQDKDLCPPLYKVIKDVSQYIQHRIEINTAYSPWEISLQEEFRTALNALHTKNK